MAETLKLAVPTMGKAGLNAQRSGHFGHCDCFTLVDIVDGELTNVSELDNPPHEEGGCIAIVDLLKEQGVQAIAAAGMGMRALCRALQTRESWCITMPNTLLWVMRQSW